MKAIVAEIDKKQMIVITDKGDFIKVKRQMSASIGDEIQLKQRKLYPVYKRLAGAAACLLACIFLSTGVYAYYTPYSYVSVDINPSLSLSLNRFERVISVKPLTEDAVGFIKDTKNLKNQDIDYALSEIIKSASDKGYIDDKAENQIIVVVSAKSSKKENELKDTLTATAAKELSKVKKNSDVTVEETSVESYKNALSNKMSPGKEVIAGKLKEVMPDIKDEEIKDMTVKEVAKLIKEAKKAEKAEKKQNKDREKEERDQKGKDEDKKGGKGAVKASGEEKKNKDNAKDTNPAAAASKKSNEDRKEKDDSLKAAEEEKDKKDKKDRDSGKEQKKKDNENKDEDKKNKNNDDPKGKVNDNKKDSKGNGNKKGQGR